MPEATTAPTGRDSRERTFLVEELFFSTTDVKGVIRSGNDVFSRIAAYGEEEMIGRPHNLIRHDDTPRAVFQLLWDEILAGRSIAAYVKNRAKDGAFYWVLAVVLPAGDGFLSVRLKPTSELFPVVQGLYRELRDLERSLESGEGKARKRAIAASLELLERRLHELGYADYTSFMRSALATELGARERALDRSAAAEPEGEPALEATRDRVTAVLRFLDAEFANLSDYTGLHETLGRRSGFVGELASAIRLSSLNARIAATRLGDDGRALSAVADLMGASSTRIAGILADLNDAIESTLALLAAVIYEISVCKLQAEMSVEFVRELLRGGADDDRDRLARRHADVALLVESVVGELAGLLDSLAALDVRLDEIGSSSRRLASELGILQALQMNGRIEAAALPHAAGVEALFAQIRERLDSATVEGAAVVALVRGAVRSRVAHDGGRRHLDQLAGIRESLAA